MADKPSSLSAVAALAQKRMVSEGKSEPVPTVRPDDRLDREIARPANDNCEDAIPLTSYGHNSGIGQNLCVEMHREACETQRLPGGPITKRVLGGCDRTHQIRTIRMTFMECAVSVSRGVVARHVGIVCRRIRVCFCVFCGLLPWR